MNSSVKMGFAAQYLVLFEAVWHLLSVHVDMSAPNRREDTPLHEMVDG